MSELDQKKFDFLTANKEKRILNDLSELKIQLLTESLDK